MGKRIIVTPIVWVAAIVLFILFYKDISILFKEAVNIRYEFYSYPIDQRTPEYGNVVIVRVDSSEELVYVDDYKDDSDMGYYLVSAIEERDGRNMAYTYVGAVIDKSIEAELADYLDKKDNSMLEMLDYIEKVSVKGILREPTSAEIQLFGDELAYDYILDATMSPTLGIIMLIVIALLFITGMVFMISAFRVKKKKKQQMMQINGF